MRRRRRNTHWKGSPMFTGCSALGRALLLCASRQGKEKRLNSQKDQAASRHLVNSIYQSILLCERNSEDSVVEANWKVKNH